MKYYYDGADPSEFSKIVNKGFISGITTNVNFVVDYASKYSINSYFEAIKPLYEIVSAEGKNLPFSIQAIGETPKEIISSAIEIKSKFNKGVKLFIKIPVNFENLFAIKYLSSEEEINVNATCITSFLQASIACSSGAKILSYFWGKMTDEGIDPVDHVSSLKKFIDANKYDAEILCGSIRQSRVIHEAFTAGADIVTLPFDYFPKFLKEENQKILISLMNLGSLQK